MPACVDFAFGFAMRLLFCSHIVRWRYRFTGNLCAGQTRKVNKVLGPWVAMSVVSLFQTVSNESIAPVRRSSKRALSEQDAIDIWVARWLRIRRKDIVLRYGCDPRRIYDIWEGTKHPASRSKALLRFQAEYPNLMDRIDFGSHQRIPRNEVSPDQLTLFGDDAA
jgi:hypothetical protein